MTYRFFIKPALDFSLALISIVLFIPLFIFIGILIKLDSKGPVFFNQERLGKEETPFRLYKFRTMTHKKRIVKQVYEDDPEVTRIGKTLRRLKIDELPQLFNILLGQMSIVGPRPCLESLRPKFDKNTPYRFQVKPGLTSLAAIKGSIFLSWSEKWYYDKVYVEQLSFLFDLKIILNTITLIFIGEKAFIKNNK